MAKRKRKYSREQSSLDEETSTSQEEVVEVKVRKPKRVGVKYRQVVYVGTADQSTVRGAITGKKYTFFKDAYKMPKPTKVDERDYPGIIVLKGKGCARRDPNALYMSKLDWDLELEKAKAVNR